MTDGKLRFYDKGKETFTIDDSSWGKFQTPEMKLEIKEMTHEEMLEEAERRENEQNEELEDAQNWIAQNFQEELQLTEKEKKVLDIAKNLMEENKEAFQHLAAIERKEFAEKDFEDLTRDQKIQLALEEIDWIVIGGQDGEEFYGSIQFLRKVLRSLR